MNLTQPDRRWVLAGGLWLAAAPALGQPADPVVETTSGKVRGRAQGGALAFKGVPYGEPTGGAGRFMPARPRAPWAGVRDTFEYGDASPQVLGAAPAGFHPTPIPASPPRPQSEDCLVLNVWTPATRGKRAVIFWIHGGGLAYGSGSSVWYDGANLAARQDVVVVTINHRLNAFGFTDLSAYGERYAQSGNVGLSDCVLALQWVRDNIGRFGGDPSRVALVGESGGGYKISALLAFAPAKGLFHRAVMQSGSGLRADSRERAAEKARRLLAELNLAPGDIAAIHDVPTETLRAAGARAQRGFGGWRPVVDGTELLSHPFDPGAPAISRDVPILTGTNRTEDSLFMGIDPAMDTLDEAGLRAKVAAIVPPGQADAVLATYRRLFPSRSNAEIAYMAVTDRGFFLDSVLMAERKAAQGGAAAYLYVFERQTPVQDGRYFAPHASEIPFVFDTLGVSEASAGPVTPPAQALAGVMSAMWASFAKTGRPSAPGMPAWPAYDALTRPTMIFDEPYGAKVEADPRSEQRRMMAAFGSSQLNPPTPV